MLPIMDSYLNNSPMTNMEKQQTREEIKKLKTILYLDLGN